MQVSHDVQKKINSKNAKRADDKIAHFNKNTIRSKPALDDITDTVVETKTGITLNVNSEYSSVTFVQLLHYVEKQCLLPLNKKLKRDPSKFVYAIKLYRKFVNDQGVITGLLCDLCGVWTDQSLKTSILDLDRGFNELLAVRRVIIYNRYFLSRFKDNEEKIVPRELLLLTDIKKQKLETTDREGKMINTSFFTWRTACVNDYTSILPILNNWYARCQGFEFDRLRDYPFTMIERIEHINPELIPKDYTIDVANPLLPPPLEESFDETTEKYAIEEAMIEAKKIPK